MLDDLFKVGSASLIRVAHNQTGTCKRQWVQKKENNFLLEKAQGHAGPGWWLLQGKLS